MINYVEAIYRIQKILEVKYEVFLSIIWFLIVISVIVIVHEFGHFYLQNCSKQKLKSLL